MRKLTATELRQNLYRILDEVAQSGETVTVLRKGKRISITAESEGSRLDRLEAHDVVVGDPEELVHIDWPASWHSDGDLV